MLPSTEMLARETPPRAWGRLEEKKFYNPNFRNTPTSVGKTLESPLAIAGDEKHPHERGEDCRKGMQQIQPKKHPHERGEDGKARQGKYL